VNIYNIYVDVYVDTVDSYRRCQQISADRSLVLRSFLCMYEYVCIYFVFITAY